MNYNLPSWYLKSLRSLVVAVAGLVVLGASVRVMNAGLACPDWPLCFGNVIPDFHPQVYFEFIHRALAGLIGLTTVTLQIILMRSNAPRILKFVGGAILVVLFSQIILGGLTVLMQLKSGVVAAHLAFGTGLFGLLLWQSLELQKKPIEEPIPAYVTPWTQLVVAAIYGQILLGGLVASNYAGLACTDFPTCQGQWIPTLAGPVGLQVMHRLGAYFIILIVGLNYYALSKTPRVLRKQATMMLGVTIFQIVLGISNVIFYIPPVIAILHLAIAVKLLYLAIRQAHIAQQMQSVENMEGRLA